MAGKFEVYESATGVWRWRLRSEQGEVVLTSGGIPFQNKDVAKADAQSVADAAKGAKVEA